MGFVAVLEQRSDITSSVYVLTFRPEGVVSWAPGQFFNIWVPLVLNGVQTRKRKSYSVASAPRQDGAFDICIKRVKGGAASNELYSVPLGSRLDFEGPLGHFVLREGKSHLLFLAAGTGVSPFRAMLHELEARGMNQTVTLIHGVRAEGDLLFREEFEALARRFSSFQYVPSLSRPDHSWHGARGYVQSHLSSVMEESPVVDVYVCGLAPMVKACVEEAGNLGVPKERIHRELYT